MFTDLWSVPDAVIKSGRFFLHGSTLIGTFSFIPSPDLVRPRERLSTCQGRGHLPSS